MPNRIDEEGKDVRDHSNKEGEFDEFLPAPCAFEIFASKIDDSGGDDKRNDVVLNQSAGEEGPGKYD